jgi:hypothetical protein
MGRRRGEGVAGQCYVNFYCGVAPESRISRAVICVIDVGAVMIVFLSLDAVFCGQPHLMSRKLPESGG